MEEIGPVPLVSELREARELSDDREPSEDELGDLESPSPVSRGSISSDARLAEPLMSIAAVFVFVALDVAGCVVTVVLCNCDAGSPVMVVDVRATMSLSGLLAELCLS